MFKKMVFIVASAFLALCFTSCSDNAESPETVVTNFLNAVKASDAETISALSNYEHDYFDLETDVFPEQNKAIRENLMFEIISSDEQGDTATVVASITNVDGYAIFKEYETKTSGLSLVGLSTEEIEKIWNDAWFSAFENNKKTPITTEINILLTKDSDHWIVSIDNALQFAIMGESLLADMENLKSKMESPETVVTNYLNAVKSSDSRTVSLYSNYDFDSDYYLFEDDSVLAPYNEEVRKSMTFKILSSNEQKNSATVTVSITNVDAQIVTTKYGEELDKLFDALLGLSEEELDSAFQNILLSVHDRNKDATVTKEVDVLLTKDDERWIVTTNLELANAVLGNR